MINELTMREFGGEGNVGQSFHTPRSWVSRAGGVTAAKSMWCRRGHVGKLGKGGRGTGEAG